MSSQGQVVQQAQFDNLHRQLEARQLDDLGVLAQVWMAKGANWRHLLHHAQRIAAARLGCVQAFVGQGDQALQCGGAHLQSRASH